MSTVDGHELCGRLLKAGVPAGPVMNTAEVMEHPHTVHRDMAWAKDWYNGTGTPIKFSRTPGGLQNVPPQFGANTDEILSEGGFSDDEISELKQSGVVPGERRK
jgi:formyl-CoA transferase